MLCRKKNIIIYAETLSMLYQEKKKNSDEARRNFFFSLLENLKNIFQKLGQILRGKCVHLK